MISPVDEEKIPEGLRESSYTFEMLTPLQSNDSHVIEVSPDAVDEGEYIIQIKKKKRGTLIGLELGTVEKVALGHWTKGGLKVKEVQPGPVREWNRSHPNMEVCMGDIIVEVNSVTGRADALLEKLGDEKVLK